jgi:Fe-S-cluster containining protein
MSGRELPVLNFAPFRRYPTKLDQQEISDSGEVCNNCLSGVCCVNQDAIALSSFDIFRLAAFFDMSPASFMLTFTQDKFGDGDDEEFRRNWNRNPNSSVVTWLRRRTNSPSSPCIFLKYVRDPDGTPHRTCSVHDARPLSCREYYFVHCKARGTGELASLLAEGFEKVRDGEITEDMVDAELARFGAHNFETSTLAKSMEYDFWVEMKCVLNMDQANVEGSNCYNIADYQDPIDEKLNRVLSSKYLRSEEFYGWKPRDEQLMAYTAGLSFAGSAEYRRIMNIVQTPPSSGLHALGNYPYYVGVRTMLPGVKHSDLFPAIPDLEINAFLNSLPRVLLFQRHPLAEVRSITQHDLYAAVLKAYNYLLRFASHIASLEPILECDPPGTIETELFKMLTGFETSLNPYVANNPYLEPVKHHMVPRYVELLEKQLAAATTAEDVFDCLRSLTVLQQTKCLFPRDLQTRVDDISRTVHARLQKDKLELYICVENPVETRRVAGKRLGLNEAHQAWGAWYSQVLDIRYAALAGFDRTDLPTFYRKAVDDLEKLPLRKSYAGCLFDIIKYLSQSMSLNHRISYWEMPYKDAADRLASYGVQLFNWDENRGEENCDCEILAEFLVAVYKGLGLSFNQDENFGLITYRILASQLADGSWKTDLRGEEAPDDQAEFLETMYRATCACINALRPTQSYVLNPANAALGLV